MHIQESKGIKIGTRLVDHCLLHLLKDHVALRTFSLENLIALEECGDYSACFFMRHFVCLNLAVQNASLLPVQCLESMFGPFIAFFHLIRCYPEPGGDAGIWEIGGNGCPRKTFWTKGMCVWGCNLCVAFYSAIKMSTGYPMDLARGRIGSQSVECVFETTRSELRGDTRWETFLKAELKAVLIPWLIKELDLHPSVRRWKNEAGITMNRAIPQFLLRVPFTGFIWLQPVLDSRRLAILQHRKGVTGMLD
jgi:hypothetical protein